MNDPAIPDTIRVLDHLWPITYGLRADTALLHCTTFTVIDDTATLAALRPVPCLSSGERLLMQVAAWLNGLAELPDLLQLRDSLDTPNWIVVRDLIADTDQVDDLMYALSAAEVRETLR
jgi:hypothetical protein